VKGNVSSGMYARLIALAGMAVILGILYYYWKGGGASPDAPGSGGVAGGTAAGGVLAGGTGGAGGTVAPGTTAAPLRPLAPAGSPVRKVAKDERSSLAKAILSARSARLSAGPAGTSTGTELDKEYIRASIKEIVPLLRECYESALAERPGLSGKVEVEFLIAGEPEAGGMVETSAIMETSTLTDPGMQECVRETMYALELPAPPRGGTVMVRYPFVFSDDGPEGVAPPGSTASPAGSGAPASGKPPPPKGTAAPAG